MKASYLDRTTGNTVNDKVETSEKHLQKYFPKGINFQVFNTMGREKMDFDDEGDKEILVYTCWPTVYHYAHIWNLRSYVFPDILKRLLRYSWYDVKQMMNFTDVGHLTDDGDDGEDKMGKAVQRENTSALEIAKKYETAFIDDVDTLNLTQPTEYVKASDAIGEQIEMILKLEEKGLTYVIEGDGVYMDTAKDEEYGKLTGKAYIEWLQFGKRVGDVGKRSKTDFALWKFNTAQGNRLEDLERESPWGRGFPGWHIECSAIATYGLDKTIHFHTWWDDHKWTHHNNEICQSENCHEEEFVRYWMHGAHLNLWGQKMSKSSGDFLNLSKIQEQWIDPLGYKFFTYQTHYRKQMKYTKESALRANTGYFNLKKRIQARLAVQEGNEKQSELLKATYYKAIFTALFDDMNMPRALAEVNKMLKNKEIYGDDVRFVIEEFDKIAGLKLLEVDEVEVVVEENEVTPEVAKLVLDRLWFIKNQDDENAGIVRSEIVKEWQEDYAKAVGLAEERLVLKSGKKYTEADALRKKIGDLWYDIFDKKDGYELKKKAWK